MLGNNKKYQVEYNDESYTYKIIDSDTATCVCEFYNQEVFLGFMKYIMSAVIQKANIQSVMKQS